MMKSVVLAVIFSAVASVTMAQLCVDSTPCAAGFCCAGFMPFIGTCQPLGEIGMKCLADERIFPMGLNEIHIAACPCSVGLECQGKVNKKGIMKNSGSCQLPPTTVADIVEATTGAEVPEVPEQPEQPEQPPADDSQDVAQEPSA